MYDGMPRMCIIQVYIINACGASTSHITHTHTHCTTYTQTHTHTHTAQLTHKHTHTAPLTDEEVDCKVAKRSNSSRQDWRYEPGRHNSGEATAVVVPEHSLEVVHVCIGPCVY
jgi:hypothetical protein